jgi:hypothetical protein
LEPPIKSCTNATDTLLQAHREWIALQVWLAAPDATVAQTLTLTQQQQQQASSMEEIIARRHPGRPALPVLTAPVQVGLRRHQSLHACVQPAASCTQAAPPVVTKSAAASPDAATVAKLKQQLEALEAQRAAQRDQVCAAPQQLQVPVARPTDFQRICASPPVADQPAGVQAAG